MAVEVVAAERAETPVHHRVSRHHFDALAAGGGDVDTISTMLTAERSWRMIQLRAVLDAAGQLDAPSSPLPDLREAWDLLARAQRLAPSAVEQVLLHPQVGTWAGYLLRRLRGSATADSPLWVDLGYLHALAAAAAIRAGMTFTMRVPVRDGFAALPTLGGAHLPVTERWAHAEVAGSAGIAEIVVAGSTVRVPGMGHGGGSASHHEGWTAIPMVRVEAEGQVLAVSLDFLDPYRNLRTSTAPYVLSSRQIARWTSLLDEAWSLLVRVCPDLAAPIARGLFCVVPQPAAVRFRTMSASAGDAFGSMIISEPGDAPELAVTLVHEFQHIKLGGLLHLVSLQEGEPAQRLYAPWRDDPRPLGGLLQGMYAFVGITQFWRAFRTQASGRAAHLADFEFARWRQQVDRTLHMVRALPQLTDLGRRLVDGLISTAAAWREEAVPVEIQAAADAAATDHRVRWRLHHMRPDPQTVGHCSAAWAAGTSAPPADMTVSVVTVDAAAARLDTRAILQLWRLMDPDGFEQLRKDPQALDEHVPGAVDADLSFVAGEVDRAREAYLTELADDPESPGAWAGLLLTSTAESKDPAATTLMQHPELVRAVYQRVCIRTERRPQPHPMDVAAWIGSGALA